MGDTKGTTRDINAAKRAAMAIELRLQKLSYDEIARRVGYADRQSCHKAVQREMSRVIVEKVDTLRQEELAGLDKLEAVCWERLEDDEYAKSKLFAVDRIVAIKERRAKLMNLDIRPDEQSAQTNYLKKIILTHQTEVTTEVSV